jgi:TatD DNase family protein
MKCARNEPAPRQPANRSPKWPHAVEPAIVNPEQATWCDAHNHLQDERWGGRQAELVAVCQAAGVVRMVVNGAAETDWTAVAELARAFPSLVVPSFGCHPWHLAERSSGWRERLERFLDENPAAAVGEIGLDRWKPGLDYAGQEEALRVQLELAAARNRPASLHCLQAWGRLLELLHHGPRPECGFLLHSYGGPAELIAPLARLGAYFGFPGYYLHARKVRQREVFLRVPPDRLLVETDAPDQLLPAEATEFSLAGTGGATLNHPANLGAVYRGLAALLEEPVAALARRVAANFTRLFGPGGASPRAETRIARTLTNSTLETRNSQFPGGAEHFKLGT